MGRDDKEDFFSLNLNKHDFVTIISKEEGSYLKKKKLNSLAFTIPCTLKREESIT